MQTNQRSGFNSIAAALVALAALILIAVLLSVAMEAGGWMLLALIVGFVIVAAQVAWLISFVVRQYVQWTDARVRAQETHNNFLLNMARVGLLPDGHGGFTPIQMPQIAAPKQQSKVYDFNPSDIHTASVNYILYSIALLGDTGNRLASAPECAAATNLVNYSARSWERIVKHLSAAYDVVTQPGPIQNGGGVYVPESIGSVGRLYHHVLLNSAVEALPENRR